MIRRKNSAAEQEPGIESKVDNETGNQEVAKTAGVSGGGKQGVESVVQKPVPAGMASAFTRRGTGSAIRS